jgi:hypothetical protein
MIRPFKPAPGNFKFVFVLIDKFCKWIEYMPLVKTSFEKTVEFLDQSSTTLVYPTVSLQTWGLSLLETYFGISVMNGAL